VSAAPEALWSVDPWAATRDGEWMYGRGAGDMKWGLAAIVGAVRGLRRLGLAPRAPVSSVGRRGGVHRQRRARVRARRHRADAADPHRADAPAIWNAQVGVLWFQVRVAGRRPTRRTRRAAPTRSRRPTPSIRALRALEAELNAAPPPPSPASRTRSTSTSG
jgi:acetylornithine deacetylase